MDDKIAIPYDPDFDAPPARGAWSSLSPKAAFAAGLAAAVLGLATLGFVMLLASIL